MDDLPPELHITDVLPQSTLFVPLMPMDLVEKQHIQTALEYHKGDKRATAESLGIVL